MYRALYSARDERRTPIDQHYLDLWLAQRSNVMREATTSLVLPNEQQFIAEIDSTMLIIFNNATAFNRQNDIGYLTIKTIAQLKIMWTRKSIDLDPALRGTQAPPIFESITQPIVKTYLR